MKETCFNRTWQLKAALCFREKAKDVISGSRRLQIASSRALLCTGLVVTGEARAEPPPGGEGGDLCSREFQTDGAQFLSSTTTSKRT
jgi:hypothetical protein